MKLAKNSQTADTFRQKPGAWNNVHMVFFITFAKNFADVAELVDALDLGSSAFGRGGSSPFIRT